MIELSKINPKSLWYSVGLIATDGSLSIDGRHIVFTSKDKENISNLQKALFLEKLTIGHKSRSKGSLKKYYYIQISDVHFYKWLTSIGIGNNKSLTIKRVKVPKKFFKDFLRGTIDGDGCISNFVHPNNGIQEFSLRIYSGSKAFLEWLNNEIQISIGPKGRLHSYIKKETDHSIYILKFGKLATQKIAKRIYYTNAIFLYRKYSQALFCLQS